jgi:cell division protein FtsW (lipid II flippase)
LSAGGTSTISFSILLGIATKGAMTNKNIKR